MPPLNQALKFGLISGLILIAYSVILYVADINIFAIAFSIVNGLIMFGVMIFFTIMAINKTRDLQLEGKITFLQSLIAGFVVLLVSGYISNIFSYLLNAVIDPEYMTRQIDNFIYAWEGKMPEDALDQTIQKIEEGIDPVKAFLKNLYITPISALIVSAIISIFIKKDKTSDSLSS